MLSVAVGFVFLEQDLRVVRSPKDHTFVTVDQTFLAF